MSIVLYKGPSMLNGDPIVVLATIDSANRKTGPLVQTYIVPQMGPLLASKRGKDDSVCGKCSRRHSLGGDCYVAIFQGPHSAWKSWVLDGRPAANWDHHTLELQREARDEGLRLGSYRGSRRRPVRRVGRSDRGDPAPHRHGVHPPVGHPCGGTLPDARDGKLRLRRRGEGRACARVAVLRGGPRDPQRPTGARDRVPLRREGHHVPRVWGVRRGPRGSRSAARIGLDPGARSALDEQGQAVGGPGGAAMRVRARAIIVKRWIDGRPDEVPRYRILAGPQRDIEFAVANEAVRANAHRRYGDEVTVEYNPDDQYAREVAWEPCLACAREEHAASGFPGIDRLQPGHLCGRVR